MRTLYTYLCGVQTRSSEGNLQGNCVQKKRLRKSTRVYQCVINTMVYGIIYKKNN